MQPKWNASDEFGMLHKRRLSRLSRLSGCSRRTGKGCWQRLTRARICISPSNGYRFVVFLRLLCVETFCRFAIACDNMCSFHLGRARSSLSCPAEQQQATQSSTQRRTKARIPAGATLCNWESWVRRSWGAPQLAFLIVESRPEDATRMCPHAGLSLCLFRAICGRQVRRRAP